MIDDLDAAAADYADAVLAATGLLDRFGARGLDLGYLDGVLFGQAHWYAHVQYAGERFTVENHRGPVEALEGLARRLLAGARCPHCGRPVTLDQAATGRTDEQLRTAPLCRYRREGRRWVRGCERRRPHPRKRRRKRGRR